MPRPYTTAPRKGRRNHEGVETTPLRAYDRSHFTHDAIRKETTMPFQPDSKSPGDPILSKDWNDLVKEIQQLDTDKVNKAGDAMTGTLTIAGELKLQEGATISKISNAPLTDSDASVPTEQSVKTYVDAGRNLILEETPTPPPGYSYTGLSLNENVIGWSERASMPTPRSRLAIGVVNGVIYVIGGASPGGDLNINEAYDPATDTWTTKASMPTPRAGAARGMVNGVIYVIGGHGPGGYLNTNEAYDPATNTWTTKASMPTPRYEPAVGVVNGVIYVIGGASPGGYFNTNEAYDPATNTWTTKASMPAPRSHLAVGVVNDRIYVIGGIRSGGSYFNINEAYDPATNAWTSRAPMLTPRNSHAIGVVNGRIYVIGGYTSQIIGVNEAFQPTSIVVYIHRKN
ncbi:hypothetical protein HYR99_35505 [Candidatus Poribacteria bacterium]|nr:hypothetical protein [Candidatus Poribacteria bacterium]